jgi:tetratricopeptide (TPR) repeat protein
MSIMTGRMAEALDGLEVLERLRPDSPELHAMRARVYFALQRDSPALSELNAFIAETGGSMTTLAMRGRVHERQGRVEEALADYDAALALDGHVELYLQRSRLLMSQGDPVRALSGLSEGVDRLGGAVLLRMELIEVARSLGELDVALEQTDAISAQARVDTRALLLRAEILDEAGLYEEAERARRGALAESDRLLDRRMSATGLVDRADAYLSLGRWEEAIEDLERALAITPPSFVRDAIEAQLAAVRP